LSDDRYVINIDRDRDGIADERIEPDVPGSGHTEQPPPVDLPPRVDNPVPGSGWEQTFSDDESSHPQDRAARGSALRAFAASVIAVIMIAGMVAIGAARLVEWMDVGDTVSTLIGMLVGVACAVGAFLAIARLTRLLQLNTSDNISDNGANRAP
jgi:hypothetical protein